MKNRPPTPRDIQVRERISGAAMLGRRAPRPVPAAVDVRPEAGDVFPRGWATGGPGERAVPLEVRRRGVIAHHLDAFPFVGPEPEDAA